MAISTEKRKAGPFTSNGTAVAYNFQFKVFSTSQVAVLHSDANGRSDVVLDKGAYSVKLNRNQDEQPGGVVTLNSPLPAGVTLSVLSDIPALQEMVLTNRGGFYPEVLNDSADKAIALIQQLEEKSERTLTVPASSSKTPSDLMSELLAAQSDASKYADAASKYADAAAQSASTAGEIEKRLTDQEAGIAAQLTQIGDQKLGEIRTEGTRQTGIVKAEGDAQAARLGNIADMGALAAGMACSRRCWQVSAPVSAGAEIVLPDQQQYVVGRNHLLVYYDDLYVDPQHFAEVGVKDTLSSKITLTFDIKPDVIRPHHITTIVMPLGRQDCTELFDRVKTLEDAVAQLSRTVAYVQTTQV